MGSAHSAAVESAKKGDVEAIKKLLQRSDVKEWLNKEDKDGRTPLHWACINGHLEVAKLLVSSGANVSCTDKNGKLPLEYVSDEKQKAEISQLFMSSTHSAAVESAKKGDMEAIKKLLQRSDVKEWLNKGDKWGRTPFHEACIKGHLDVAKLLVSSGANVNSADNWGRTPLHEACINGHWEVAKFLVSSGANVNCTDKSGRTPLDWACRNGHSEVMKFLVSSGANLNWADKSRPTPLHEACINGHLELVKSLVSSGAYTNWADKSGRTPLYEACIKGHLEVAKFLVSSGANVNCCDKGGWTPLRGACYNGHLEVMKFLVSSGANVNCADGDGWTPLHEACINGYLKVVKFLVSSGANINCVDKDGRTPLHWSCINGYLEVAKLLVSSGANVSCTDERGKQPLDYVSDEKKKAEISQLFDSVKEQGAEREKEGAAAAAARPGLRKAEGLKQKADKAMGGGDVEEAAALYSQCISVDPESPVAIAALGCRSLAFLKLKMYDKATDDASAVLSHDPHDVEALYRRALAHEGASRLDKAIDDLDGVLRISPHNELAAEARSRVVCISAEKGDTQAIKRLLQRSDVKEWLNKDGEEGRTPLHWACINGHLEVAKLLVSSGANVNCADKNGRTPLHGACIKGHVEVAKLLMSSGGFVDMFDALKGESAAGLAFRGGHVSVVEEFIAMELKGQLCYLPAPTKTTHQFHHHLLSWLLSSPSAGMCDDDSPPLGGGDGWSLLHVVCKERKVKVDLVKMLLEGGLDATKRDQSGKLPVDYVSDEEQKAEVSCVVRMRESLQLKHLGDESCREGNYETAVQHYSEAIRLDSSNAALYNSRAEAFLTTAQYLNAEADASHVIDSGDRGGLLTAYYHRALARKGINIAESLQGALDDINQVISSGPENKEAVLEKQKIERLMQLKAEELQRREDAIAAHKREAERARLEREKEDRVRQLEEENQRLKTRLEQQQGAARSSHDFAQEQQVAAERARESQSSREAVDQFEASVIGASSLGSVSVPSRRGAANETQLPPVPPASTVQHSSVTGASSLSSPPAPSRRGAPLETAPPPVTPLSTVGASSLSSAGEEKEQRSAGASRDSSSSLGARVVQVQDVKLGEVIGRGAFGKVHKGECDFQDVAVKVFECGSSIPEEVAEKVRQEVQVMCQLSHPNIVRLYGLVERADSPPMLVMEFGAGGSLYSYLRRREFADRPWSHRLRIAFELSRGLAYLHMMNVVHRDIKSLNVILDEYGKAMWCDFGLSVTKEHVLTTSTANDAGGSQEGDREQVAGTLRWLAPEQFSFKHSTPSRASDVWSLGMVFFEIASQQVPYSRSTNKDVIRGWIKDGEGEEIPEDCEAKAPVLADMMRRCWLERSARPSAADIAEELKTLV